MQDIFEKMQQLRVIPVIAIDSVEAALPLADALIEGGLPIAEITFRTEAAAAVIAKLTRERPNLIIGAGTVLSVETLQKAIDCGAVFGVAPGTNPAVVAKANELGFPFIPGIATPSEVEQAMALGAKALKFFPAEASGGVGMINALTAPYGHTGVKFMPTGGVTAQNVGIYLALHSVIAVGGTWIATKDDIAQGSWNEITAKCRAACDAVRVMKG